MIEERLDKLLEHLEEVQPDTCPIIDADANADDLPFCNGEYCMNQSSAGCWKKWLTGEQND